MKTENTGYQSTNWYKTVSIFTVLGIFLYFRRTIYKKYFAWIYSRLYKPGFVKERTRIFQFVHEYKNQQKKDLTILDVGSGPASNCLFLPQNSKLICMEPNPNFDKYARETLKKKGNTLSVEIVHGYGEKMPFENESIDVVVCTLVLCSVQNMKKCLSEFKRVLRPGGKYIFLEHVAYEDRTTWLWTSQWLLCSLQRLIFDNCEPNRDIETYIRAAGFSDVSVKRFLHPPFFFWFRPCISGAATK